jgi:hypothetical protein
MFTTDRKYQIISLLLLFLIPLNIYRIGNNLGSGIQWAFFHYQQTIFGSQIFTIFNDLDYVFTGLIDGKSAVSLLLWSCAAFILIAVLTALVIGYLAEREIRDPWVSILVILSGFLFLFSCMAQYGITFHGPAGFCVPIGIPVVWAVGILLYQGGTLVEKKGEATEDVESKSETTDGRSCGI